MWDFGQIAFGGDYNPEQWDEATIAEDIKLMKQAKVNLVSLGVFAWARLEPVEGQYDLDWLESIINRLYDNGIFTDLGTATASPPAWMAKKYPQTLPVNAEGTVLGFGSRQQYCPSHPIYREKAAALVEQLARRFGSHPAVKLWHVSNELGCHVAMCYCAESAQAFRVYLQERYGSIEALNQAWGTDFWAQRYSDFAHISPPAATPTFPNPAQVLDWKRFSSHELLGCYLNERRVIRQHSDVPMTTNFMGAFEYSDYFDWAKHIDLISDDSYPDPANPGSAAQVAFEADLARSYHNGPFLLMEQSTAAVQWRSVNSAKRRGQNQLWSLQRMAHGADGIMHFQWRQSKSGAEAFHSAMVPYAGRDTRIFSEVCQLGDVVARLGAVAGSDVDTPVALVWDWGSEWGLTSSIWLRPARFSQAARAWHRTLFEAGYPADFISLKDLAAVGGKPGGASGDSCVDGCGANHPEASDEKARDLGKYKLIVVPQTFAMDAESLAGLKELARAGAQVIIAAPSAVTDENLCAYEGEGPQPLETLTGVRVLEPWPLSEPELKDNMYPAPDPRVDRITAAVATPMQKAEVHLDVTDDALRKTLDGMCQPTPALRGQVWAEALRITAADVQVLAEYCGSGGAADLANQPAITRRDLGKGGVYYLSADLDAAGRTALFKLAALRARLANPLGERNAGIGDLPAGVQGVMRGRHLFLLNHGDAMVRLPGVVGLELITGTEVCGQLILPPRSGAVVQQQ